MTNEVARYAKLLDRMEDASSAPAERVAAQKAVKQMEVRNPGLRAQYLALVAAEEAKRAAARSVPRPRRAPSETPLQAAVRRAALWGLDVALATAGTVADDLTQKAAKAVEKQMKSKSKSEEEDVELDFGTIEWEDEEDLDLSDYVDYTVKYKKTNDPERGDNIVIKVELPVGLFEERLCESKRDARDFLRFLLAYED